MEEGREEGAGVEGSSVCRQSVAVAADMEQVTETSTRREHAPLRESAPIKFGTLRTLVSFRSLKPSINPPLHVLFLFCCFCFGRG